MRSATRSLENACAAKDSLELVAINVLRAITTTRTVCLVIVRSPEVLRRVVTRVAVVIAQQTLRVVNAISAVRGISSTPNVCRATAISTDRRAFPVTPRVSVSAATTLTERTATSARKGSTITRPVRSVIATLPVWLRGSVVAVQCLRENCVNARVAWLDGFATSVNRCTGT